VTVEEFIAKWEKCSGHERANYAAFLSDFAHVLGVPTPGPGGTQKLGDYQFDGPVPGGAEGGGTGFIDLYKRGCFILEAKQSRVCEVPSLPGLDAPAAEGGGRYDELMRRAFRQARRYAQSLPEPPWPPSIITLDVGRAFELHFDFGGNGRDYRFFPDRASYRVPLAALATDDAIGDTGKSALELLKAVWTDPRSIDPRSQSADVTREVARRLAEVSKYIEEMARLKSTATTEAQKSEEVEESALFLMRILFCMFAEDIGLLPRDKFKDFLLRSESSDHLFEEGLADLWLKMGSANPPTRFAHALEKPVRYFNGGLFRDTVRTYRLSSLTIHDLYEAARQNWRKVEPAIFGTLLEQALSPEERAKLGAHYTPRPYVETLVRATIMDVLEPEWAGIEDEISALITDEPQQASDPGSPHRPVPRDDALVLAAAFHERLSTIRVLDPACGTGNFLYVSMELMQALEARVIETIHTLGGDTEPKVGPHQFYGLEKNPRAAKIAELVLWIGWLRNRLHDDPDSVPQPVLAESASINFGKHGGYDAVLKMNALGQPDLEHATIPAWPEAEFIVGNPPFIGAKYLRDRLGSDYAEALWAANPRVPKSADFVMHWWDRAAHTLVASDSPLIRFGFVTTNSITQEFSRRVIGNYLSPSPLVGEDQGGGPAASAAEKTRTERAGQSSAPPARRAPTQPSPQGGGLSLVMAIPDHPWTKASKDSAAVRIAMTVAERGTREGELREVTVEEALDSDEPKIVLTTTQATIHPNLTTGADVTSVVSLRANDGLASPGVKLHGAGFIVPEGKERDLGLGVREGAENHIRPYRNGRDLLGTPRNALVIDLFGLAEQDVRQRFPELYQHLLAHVWDYQEWNRKEKRWIPAGRKYNRRASYRDNWWIFGEPRKDIRPALDSLVRFIATPVTAKHRIFQFLSGDVLPDDALIAFAINDGYVLGVLQSAFHTFWAASRSGTLEDRERYNKSSAFDPFPFPDPSPKQRATIADLAEELDATRKAALAETDRLTMTELYNLREQLRVGAAMDDKQQRRATKARAAIVNRLHEQLDAAVADAYGWGEDWRAGALGPSEIVARLVALNHERAAEEKVGKIRWLRPEYQIPRFAHR
jgi:type I restriction-modification system DNA methylase subunit